MSNLIDTLNQVIEYGLEKDLVQLFTENESIDGTSVTINGKTLINFGSCSYLGLEHHPQLIEGIKIAAEKFGSQFSTSRSYLSIGLYRKLESSLRAIFDKPVMVAASTTLGHLSALPTLVDDDDAVILDFQVHSSVQMAAQFLKSRKIPLYIIPHNSMESLENKIKTLRNKHRKIWYLADGVYSMYGDVAPLTEIERMLNTYKQFHVYIDDAHGSSWAGKHGSGYVRSQIAHHSKMILAISLNKSFASSGGAIVFPNSELEQKVRNCGSTMIFSGPIQPPMLGAAIASVKFHQSNEFIQYQNSLKTKIEYTNKRLKALGLPQYKESETPLFFIPVGVLKIVINIIQRMKCKGYFLNTASFPAVPMKKGGIRFMINNNLSLQHIDAMLVQLQREYVFGLEEEDSSLKAVSRIFKIPAIKINQTSNVKPIISKLSVETFRSITSIQEADWNNYFTNNGNLSYNNLRNIETTFSNQTNQENNWNFYYVVIKDIQEKIVLMSSYICALMKDDMFSPVDVSQKIEQKRQNSPYYLTSKNVISGSMITKGEPIYLDRKHPEWKQALASLIKQMQITVEEEGASKLMLREFSATQNAELKHFMLEQGLIEYKLANNSAIDDLSWNSKEAYIRQIDKKYRYNFRKEILALEDCFKVCYDKLKTSDERKYGYKLYSNVFDKSYELNVFKLPYSFFELMYEDENYDIIRLYSKESPIHPISIMFSYVNDTTYNALIVGIDYSNLYRLNPYKQILYRTVQRAKMLGCKSLDLAFTAEMEKKKVGAKVHSVYAYVQAMEHHTDAVLQFEEHANSRN